jgi:hypothetical protein
MKSEIADGVYDNTGTMQRELWHEGKVVAHATAIVFFKAAKKSFDAMNKE